MKKKLFSSTARNGSNEGIVAGRKCDGPLFLKKKLKRKKKLFPLVTRERPRHELLLETELIRKLFLRRSDIIKCTRLQIRHLRICRNVVVEIFVANLIRIKKKHVSLSMLR